MKRLARAGAARAPKDILGGLLLILVGLLALWLAQGLPSFGRVGFGSGTAPRLLACALLLLGAFIMIWGVFNEGEKLAALSWRGIITVLGSVLVFALTIRLLGLFGAGVPMMLLASAAAPGYRWKEALLFSVAITAFCALLFPFALGQPIPLWPTI